VVAGYSGGLARWVALVFVAVLWGAHAPATAIETESQALALPRYFTINEVLARLGSRTSNPAASSATQVAAIATMGARDAAAATSERGEPFGLTSFRAPNGLLWVKWRALLHDLTEEADALAQCRATPERCSDPIAKTYLAMIAQARQLSGRAKIAWLNRTINAAIRYMSDPDQYGVDDLWTAPLATLRSGLGDCEDYAIAKYVALRDAGYAAEDLRLVIVRDRLARQDHAVTAVREGGRWVLLDNRHDVLLERKDAWHFTPMFALDRTGVKLFAVPYGAPPAEAPAQVASAGADAVSPAQGAPVAAEAEDFGAAALGLRLDAFEPPPLRGGL
jgi:predicted transglutaminase-like cysteine proteinase